MTCPSLVGASRSDQSRQGERDPRRSEYLACAQAGDSPWSDRAMTESSPPSRNARRTQRYHRVTEASTQILPRQERSSQTRNHGKHRRTRKGKVDSDSLFRAFRWIPWLISDPSGAAIGCCWTESAVRIWGRKKVAATNGTRLSLTHWALRCYGGKHRHID